MVSSPKQSSLSLKLNQGEISSIPPHSDSIKSLSQTDLIVESSFTNKLKSGMIWLLHPFEKCCSSRANHHQTSKNLFDSQCLKPEFNRVNGLLKYFTFGVMFTNGMLVFLNSSYLKEEKQTFRLGFIVFLIGLWSSFENRKIGHMPTVNSKDSTSLNPFNFLGIMLCIFGVLFFFLCLISCLGINRENLNLLRISLLGQILTLIIFLISAVWILIWGEKIRNKIIETLMIGLKVHYHIDKAWTAFFDQLHMNYFCCGMSFSKISKRCDISIYGRVFQLLKEDRMRYQLDCGRTLLIVDCLGVYSFSDWHNNPQYACTSSNVLQNLDACSVPFTCCKAGQQEDDTPVAISPLGYTCGMNILPSDNLTINMDDIQQRIHVNGCFDEILPVVQQLIITAAVFMLLICIIVFVTIFLTCLLIFEIRLTISDVERYCRKKRQRYEENSLEKEEEKF